MSDYSTKKIKEILDLVDSGEWVLPTFQRKYVWDQDQICDLFDSIMRTYPIGTFMVWKMSKDTASNNFFYRFIRDYQERWQELGESFSPRLKEYYYAVIDGQQRINSIFIGYCGSYAIKKPRVHWKNSYDESIQPKTYLYLNLFDDADENTSRVYDFCFFSDAEYKEQENLQQWYKVGDILDFPYIEYDDVDDVIPDIVDEKHLLDDCSPAHRKTALQKIKRLYRKTFHTPIINYYEDKNQKLERVVDVFLRTNGGGTPLEFSDLVMSVTIQHWPGAKDKIEDLMKLVFTQTDITINKDFVLKVFLVLFSKDISFKVKNFEANNAELIRKAEKNFDKISGIILETCKFANQIGLNDVTLRSKYALIPLIYYSFKNPSFEIANVAKDKETKKNMAVWIKTALLKSMFGGKPDAVLSPIKRIIDTHTSDFPTKKIIDEFRYKTKDISIDRSFIEDRIANSQYGSPEAYLLLSLAMELDPQQVYNVDHMYPKDMFKKSALKKMPFLATNQNLMAAYSDKNNWNTVGNLQLLNASENRSKSNSKLSDWTRKEKKYNWTDYFIPKDAAGNLIVQDDQFIHFVIKRRELLADAIMKALTI